MENIVIRRYQPEDYLLWNNFVKEAKNATFLFHRDFMEYHKDRFEDFSLLIFFNNKLSAILPANLKNNSLFSHEGLTYGGIVISEKLRSTVFFSIFKKLLIFLKNNGIEELYIKGLPHFYTSQFSDEIKYLQFILSAEVYRKDICSVIDFSAPYEISSSVIRDKKRAISNGYKIDFDGNLSSFWNDVLIPNLQATFQKKPVHSLNEILYLKSKFPENIKQINVLSNEDRVVGGTTLFFNNQTIHSQYISVYKNLPIRGVLDYLHCSIFDKFNSDYKYFDFGISNENEGRKINKGLLEWKEKFGARAAIQEFYRFEINKFELLNTIYL